MYLDVDADKYEAFCWAHKTTQFDKDWVVLDTETTGLDWEDEIIEIAILFKDGSTLFHSCLNPSCEINPNATAIHGLTKEDLKDAPTFLEISDRLTEVLTGKVVLIYNASFDMGKLRYLYQKYGLDFPDIVKSSCVMDWYAQYYGDWHSYYQNYTWQKLPGGDHTALGDARATYNLIYKMAQLDGLPKELHPVKLFPPFQIGGTWECFLSIQFYWFIWKKQFVFKFYYLKSYRLPLFFYPIFEEF